MAMIATSLYNIVDSIFIGQGCGPIALAGLTVAKPFMDICAAFGSLVGVGAGTLVAIKLGARKYDTAGLVLGNVILMNVILSSVVMVVGLLFLRPILYTFGASEDTITPAYEYMEVILWGNIVTHLFYGLNNVLRSMGKPIHSMSATIAAVTINTILDPIFIFTLDMGVRGAALATVLAQIVVVVWQFVLFSDKRQIIHIHHGIWTLDHHITRRVIAIGLSPFLMNLAHSMVVVVVNNQLAMYGGDIALAAYGIVFRFTFVFAMIVMGLNQGMQPIAGYNFGSGQYDRMRRVFVLTTFAATMVTGLMFLLAELCPELMARVFTHDEAQVAYTILPFRIVNLMMLFVGFQMVTGNFFTSIGQSQTAIFLSLTRQVILLIPLVLILPYFFTDPILGVWWSMPLSDGLSALLAMVCLNRCKVLKVSSVTDKNAV